MDIGLSGKSVIVTGGTRGIGRGISEELLAEGAKVTACFGSDHVEAQRFLDANSASQNEGRLISFAANLSEESDHERLLDTAREKFETLDGIVNCAAIKVPENDLTLRNLSAMAIVNGIGPVALTYRALDYFNNSGGAVVNILTVLKNVYYPESPMSRAMAHHGASKGYLETASRLMTDECQRYRVRVNCVAPGPTRGGGLSKSDEVHQERFRKGQYAMNRRSEIQDVTGAVLYLLSPISEQITGQTIYVTGGQELAPFFYPPQET